ncbi:MAG: hypothetical protein AAF517_27125, partial [Planctomycetota bacterium]
MLGFENRSNYVQICGPLLVALLALCTSVRADEAKVQCRFLYSTTEGFFLDVGRDSGLEAGVVAQLVVGEEKVAEVEAVNVSTDNSFFRVRREIGDLPSGGQQVQLVFERQSKKTRKKKRSRSATLKDPRQGKDNFKPLLSPELGTTGFTEESDLFHGRMTVRQLYQLSSQSQHDFARTQLRSSGTYERIDGTPWTLEWSADFSYRSGDAVETHLNDMRFKLYRLALFRRFDHRSFVRFGRFIPRELPSLGFFDGIQGELAITDHFRVGSLVGARPTRDDLWFSGKEQSAVGYATMEVGTRRELHYLHTSGLMASLFEGSPDRMAVFTDQSFEAGNFHLFSSSEVDFDIGGGVSSRESVRLTRLDLIANYRIWKFLNLRGGADRYELPDTAAERDVINIGTIDVERFLNTSYWRYWAGAFHELPGKVRLSEEVSFTDASGKDAIRFTVSVSRRGLPGFPDGTVTLSGYNLEGQILQGYGGRLAFYLPFMDHRLILEPSVSARFLDGTTTGDGAFGRFNDR